MTDALKDGHDIVEFYNKSMLFLRVRRGRSMSIQFRDLRNGMESYCGRILSIKAPTLVSSSIKRILPLRHLSGDQITFS